MRHGACSTAASRQESFIIAPRRFTRFHGLLAALCIAAASVPAGAQLPAVPREPTVVVTGVGRLLVEPTQAVVELGATVEREEAAVAQRELAAVMSAAVQSIRQLGIEAENLTTSNLSLMPVYADDSAAAERARRPEGPRIVRYRATNIVQVTVDDLDLVGAVIDAGIDAGLNEIRRIYFGLGDEGPYRVTALERAAEAARRKAEAVANALGARLGAIVEAREQSVAVPYPQLDAAFARAESTLPIEPGEIAIEASVDVTFRLEGLRID